MNKQLEATVSQVLGTSDLTMTPLAGDASTRRYFRLNLAKNGPYPSAILMRMAEPGIGGEELPFLNVHRELSKMSVSVPKIYHDGSKEQFLILEDLGDLLLQEAILEKKDDEIQSLYELALEEIFKMQFWPNRSRNCVAYQLAFDEEKLTWELNFFLMHTLKGYLNISFNKDEEKVLNYFFKKLSSFLAHQPRYFTHRDFHSRNLLVQKSKIRVIDFQDARMGPCQYDLVSLLHDAYVPLPQKVEKSLCELFIKEHKKRSKNSFSDTVFEIVFDWMSLQRSLKAAGTFGFMAAERNNENYLHYLPRVFHNSLRVLNKYPEFKDAKEILEPHFK